MFSLPSPRRWHTDGILLSCDRDPYPEESINLTSQSIPKSWCPVPCRIADWRCGGWMTSCGGEHWPQPAGQTRRTAVVRCSLTLMRGIQILLAIRACRLADFFKRVVGMDSLKNYSLFSWPLEKLNLPTFKAGRRSTPGEMPAVSPVGWKGLPSFFNDTSKKLIH